MVNNFINMLKEFSMNTPHIESVIVVGSYARGDKQGNFGFRSDINSTC